jgi:CO/xanthine dehydrogenase Mo-binding subunit
MARSPHAHARVKRIAVQAALEVPGVVAVLTARDFKGVRLGHQRPDEPVLSPVARYVGDTIAAVAALDPRSLQRGIEALDVHYEILPHVLSMDSALEADRPIHQDCPDNVAQRFECDRGDWEEACSRVEVWAEGEFETAAVPHAYLEPRSCFVRYREPRLELVTGSHAPSILAEDYRRILGNWGADLEVVTPAIGGSFGAKWAHPTHLVCLAFAHRLRRDVSMVIPRRDDMIAGTTRVPMRIRTRIGADARGRLIAKETLLLADNGAYSRHGPAVTRAAATRLDNLYRFEAVRMRSQLVYTNNMPSECFRGFGMPQACFAQEQLLDELARRLQLDPIEMRRANAVKQGNTSIHGWKVGSCGYGDCLDRLAERIAEDRTTRRSSRSERYREGYGIATLMHCISNRGYDPRFDRASVTLSAGADGVLTVASGEVELGCGTTDVLTRIVARELSMENERLRVVLGDTAAGPHGLGSFASRTTWVMGRAALDACRQFKARSRDMAAVLGLGEDARLPQIMEEAGRRGSCGDLRATGIYEPGGVDIPDDSGYGNISPAYTFGAHACRVRVDTLTGKVAVQQYWAAHDAGNIINPAGAHGQVIGGVMQGVGLALTEALSLDGQGGVLNPGYLDDRVATFPDRVPVDVWFAPTLDDQGPAGAKTIGEPPIIPVAACVANAIFDATGRRMRQLPMTSERVWRALRD